MACKLLAWKNTKKADELVKESQVIKETITKRLRELHEGQVRQSEAVPVRAKHSSKKNMKACRSLQFSAGSPGVVVRVILMLSYMNIITLP